MAAAALPTAEVSPLQEVSTLIRYPEPTGRAWKGPDLGIPQDPMPLKFQGHEAGRMKVLFMESQQETHENIPALRIPTGKPREHSCSWDSNRKTKRTFLLVGFQLGVRVHVPCYTGWPVGGGGGEDLPALTRGAQPFRHTQRFPWPLWDGVGRLRTGLPGSQSSWFCSKWLSSTQVPCRTYGPVFLQGSL